MRPSGSIAPSCFHHGRKAPGLRYDLNKARALLEQLDVEIPELPPYDPAKDEKFFWEDELTAAIEKLRAEKEIEDAAKPNDKE